MKMPQPHRLSHVINNLAVLFKSCFNALSGKQLHGDEVHATDYQSCDHVPRVTDLSYQFGRLVQGNICCYAEFLVSLHFGAGQDTVNMTGKPIFRKHTNPCKGKLLLPQPHC